MDKEEGLESDVKFGGVGHQQGTQLKGNIPNGICPSSVASFVLKSSGQRLPSLVLKKAGKEHAALPTLTLNYADQDLPAHAFPLKQVDKDYPAVASTRDKHN